MAIEARATEIKRILSENSNLANYSECFDENLVFSRSHMPQGNAVAYWTILTQNKTFLVVFFDETIRCHQCILFRMSEAKYDCTQFDTEILEISELYNFSGDYTLMRLLEIGRDAPLFVRYSRSDLSADNFFTVEINLGRLTSGFPRIVERLADAIVFLGEVLFAGDYS